MAMAMPQRHAYAPAWPRLNVTPRLGEQGGTWYRKLEPAQEELAKRRDAFLVAFDNDFGKGSKSFGVYENPTEYIKAMLENHPHCYAYEIIK